MDNDRCSVVEIGKEKYELVLSVKATKEIAKKYGGLDNLGDKLMKPENFEAALDEVVWLITLLANQGILKNNLLNGEERELLTEEKVELLTLPSDLALFNTVITEAVHKGTKRYVESEEQGSKNEQVG